jgi:hypothetical protein
LVNAVSYLAAAALVYLWSRQHGTQGLGTDQRSERKVADQSAAARGYAAPLRDRPFLLIVATNLLFVLCAMVLDVLVAVYVIRALHLPVWLSGVLFALNTAVVALGQTTTSRAVVRLRRPGCCS